MKKNPYTLPPQKPGEYLVLVQAFDKAGNYSDATTDLTITKPPQTNASLVLTIVLGVFGALVVFLGFIIYRLLRIRRGVEAKANEAEIALFKNLERIKGIIFKRILGFDKGHTRDDFTRAEKKVIEGLEKELDATEDVVTKELEEIKKEVE